MYHTKGNDFFAFAGTVIVFTISDIASTANIAISDITSPTTSAPSTEVHLGKFPHRTIHPFYHLLMHTTIHIVLPQH